MYSLMDSSRVSTFLIPMLLIVYGSFRWVSGLAWPVSPLTRPA